MNRLKVMLRLFARSPVFFVVAVMTLAVGIGATTAIFSFVNAVLLQPLPYQDPERLVMVFENHSTNGWNQVSVGAPVLDEWRNRSASFESLAGTRYTSFVLTGNGRPETLSGCRISANSFSLLGLKPQIGRDFMDGEEEVGRHQVVLLSHGLWQNQFGGDPDLVGKTITLDARAYTVLGVMPPRTDFPRAGIQLWVPLAFGPTELAQRHAHNFLVYGRLKSDVTLQAARAEMDGVATRMAEEDAINRGWGAEVHPMHDIVVGDSRRLLLTFLGAVGCVLLIVCANVSCLSLTHSTRRAREFAIRASLGARPRDLIRQLLSESLVLAVIGGTAGVLVAWGCIQVFLRIGGSILPRLNEGVSIDPKVLGFTALVTIAVGVLFGLFPALQASNSGLIRDLNESSRGNSGGRQHSVRFSLVVCQIAASVALLICAGLMWRSFDRLIAQDLGYKPQRVLSFAINLPGVRYPDQETRSRFYDRFLAEIRDVPGVDSAAWILGFPLSGGNSNLSIQVQGAAPPAPGEAVAAGYSQASTDYFRTLGIPLIAGRDFLPQDRMDAPPVAIVDETFVKNFNLGTNVLGRRISIGDGTQNAEIVGLVEDVKYVELAEKPRGEVYRPVEQVSWNSMCLVVKTTRQRADLTQVLRDKLNGIDADLPLRDFGDLTQFVFGAVADRRISMQVMSWFASAALLLASLGLYGVLAYLVSMRRREIGIRIALGALPRHVLSLVLGQGMRMVFAGLGLGLIVAFALRGAMGALLYDLPAADPVTFVSVAMVLLIVAIVACWIPAKRATKLDPVETLRH